MKIHELRITFQQSEKQQNKPRQSTRMYYWSFKEKIKNGKIIHK